MRVIWKILKHIFGFFALWIDVRRQRGTYEMVIDERIVRLMPAILVIFVFGFCPMWLFDQQRDRSNFFLHFTRMKIGDSKEQIITHLGKPDREQPTIPTFRSTQEWTYCQKLKASDFGHTDHGRAQYERSCNDVAYGRPGTTETTQVVIWSKRYFPYSITCFAGFDPAGKVVTTACDNS